MFKSIKIILISFLLIGFANADDAIEQALKENNLQNLPLTAQTDDARYSSTIPLSVYLMLTDREALAIKFLKENLVQSGQEVYYKGIPYADFEWAELIGFNSYAEIAKNTEIRDLTKEETIKRNRDLIFTNTKKINLDIQKDKRAIEKIKKELIPLIESIDDKDKQQTVVLSAIIKLIIEGNNDGADLVIPYLLDVNMQNNNSISPLMATTFTTTLDGGNVEYALKLIHDYNADVNLKNSYGMTAMHLASASDAYKTLTALLDSKAKFMEQDDNGNMPIDYAMAAEAEKSSYILYLAILEFNKQ